MSRFTMKASVVLVAVLSMAARSDAGTAGAEVTPVQKVIQLLTGMLEKGKLEKHEEQVQYAAYKQFCDDIVAEKKKLIEENEQMIEVLKADVQKNDADAQHLAKEILLHHEDVNTWTGDMKAAAKVREIERVDYEATHKDYSESLDALERAIAFLRKQNYNRKQKESLLSILKNIPEEAKGTINAFLSTAEADDDADSPEAYAYEFQSSGVIEMLEKLLDKFADERTALEKEETNSRHAYELLRQDLKTQIDQANGQANSKTERKAKHLQNKADAVGNLQDTVSSKQADEKYLADISSTCEQKASDFEQRQQLRAEEIQAIEKAVDIISGGVASAADKHLPALVQKQSKPAFSSFAQLRSVAHTPQQERAARFLERAASELDSRVLSALATHVADDPFVKVKKMIKDLVVRLMEEANEEAEHKQWCDAELATNEQTRKEKSSAVETLQAEIDELSSSVSTLAEEIADLSKAVSELDAAMAKATKLRMEEKSKNEQTIQDAGDAQSAIAQAMVVLKEFYAKAAESTALVQGAKNKKQPEIFDSPYKGMAGDSGGVLGLLEVIETDFARLESETKATEVAAQQEYDEFMTDSDVDKAQKTKDSEHKASKKQDHEQALVSKKTDLEGTHKELDASLSYYEKLKPSCVNAGMEYTDRVSRRKEEIESLQEALRILNGDDIA